MKDKSTAGILAFFLGGIGVHRFYLGQIGLGFAYLIFFWTFIPAFISLIDMIVFFTQDKENFDMKYNRKYVDRRVPLQQTLIINNATKSEEFISARIQGLETDTRGERVNNLLNKSDPFEVSGDLKYEDYDFDGAIEDFLKSLKVNPNNSDIHFKLSCLYSLLEQKDSSFFHLNRAVEKGFNDINQIKTHDHLAYIRMQQPTYDAFVSNGFKLMKSIEPSDKLELSNSIITQIEKLAKLKDQGILNEEEFSAQKTKLLNH